MIPAWIESAAMTASMATIRILIHIARAGVASTAEDGAPVIIARLSYSDLQAACHLARHSVATGIQTAVQCGWLEEHRSGYLRRATTYIMPMFIGAAILPSSPVMSGPNRAGAGGPLESDCGPGAENAPGR